MLYRIIIPGSTFYIFAFNLKNFYIIYEETVFVYYKQLYYISKNLFRINVIKY